MNQRFEAHKDLKTTSKIHLQVQFPLQVNMLPYTNRAKAHDARENSQLVRSCTYDLLSVVVHIGKLNSGVLNSGAYSCHYAKYTRSLHLLFTRRTPGLLRSAIVKTHEADSRIVVYVRRPQGNPCSGVASIRSRSISVILHNPVSCIVP